MLLWLFDLWCEYISFINVSVLQIAVINVPVCIFSVLGILYSFVVNQLIKQCNCFFIYELIYGFFIVFCLFLLSDLNI